MNLDGARELLTREVGPLPVWGWGLAGVGGVILGRMLSGAFAGSDGGAEGDTAAEGAPAATVGSAYGLEQGSTFSGGDVSGPVEAPTTNTEWRQRALKALLADGYAAVVADTALSGYLDERELSDAERAIVDRAITSAGLPPNPPALMPATPPPVVPPPSVVVVSPPPAAAEDQLSGIVRAAYRDVLGREADAVGLAFWRARLAAGQETSSTLRTKLAAAPESLALTPSMPAGTDPATTVPAPTTAPPVAAVVTYTVKSGDSLSKIGRQFGVSASAIYSANTATIGGNPNLIRPGQVLTIPN